MSVNVRRSDGVCAYVCAHALVHASAHTHVRACTVSGS